MVAHLNYTDTKIGRNFGVTANILRFFEKYVTRQKHFVPKENGTLKISLKRSQHDSEVLKS